MGHACQVSYHQVASVVPGVRYWKLAVRIRGTIVPHVCFAIIGRTLKVSPICAHDTHNPRFSRPALRKQFSTHDAVDIITMFRFQLFYSFAPCPSFRSITPGLTFFLFFPNLSSFDGFLLFRDPSFILL